jgi:hypothetical protein
MFLSAMRANMVPQSSTQASAIITGRKGVSRKDFPSWDAMVFVTIRPCKNLRN